MNKLSVNYSLLSVSETCLAKEKFLLSGDDKLNDDETNSLKGVASKTGVSKSANHINRKEKHNSHDALMC